MPSVRIELTDAEMSRLEERAGRLSIPVEALAHLAVWDLLFTKDEEFERVASSVLKKNQELYRRLV